MKTPSFFPKLILPILLFCPLFPSSPSCPSASFVSAQTRKTDHEPPGLSLLSNLASNIPLCAHGCINQLTNITTEAEACLLQGKEDECLCDEDVDHYTAVLSCVQRDCTLEESVETARGAWEACGKPQRSRRRDLLAGPLTVECLALLCVALRLYSRWRLVSRFEVDDWVMVAVVVLYFGFMGFGLSAALSAFGVDIWTVSANVLGQAFKFFYISESFYIAILTLTKISILCFYLRIFPNKTFRLVTFAAMGWVGASGFIFVFCQIFQCVPIRYIWEGWRKGEFGPFRCLDINVLTYTIAGFSIAQDMFILLMPLPLLINLNVSRRSKAGIIFMFSLGIFVLITSCVRLRAIYIFGDSVNPTWDYTDTIIWTGLEVAVSMIVTSLPAIRVLLSRRGGLNPWGSSRGHQRVGGGGFVGGGGGRGGGRGGGGGGVTSTSSFGDTTVVASWGSAPPHLKRISAVSRISSIHVGRPSDEDVENQQSGLTCHHIDWDDKMTDGGALGPREMGMTAGSRPTSEARTMVGIEDDGYERCHQYVVARDLKHMPSIDEILSNGGGGKWSGGGSNRLTTKASLSSYSSMRSLAGSSCTASGSKSGSSYNSLYEL